MIKLKPKTPAAEAKMVDKLYDFAKAVYFGQSPGWNGNNIPLAIDENFVFETEEGKFSTDKMFKKVRGTDPKNYDIKYWYSFVQKAERDKTMLQMHIDGLVLDFWMIYPEVNGSGWERWMRKNYEVRKNYFDLRINTKSAILLSKHWEEMFKTEINQYYQVAVDKRFLSKLREYDQAKKTASEMYLLGLDKVILKYKHSDPNSRNHYHEDYFATYNIDGSTDGSVTGSTICKELSEQIIYAVQTRKGFQKTNIEKFEKKLKKLDLKDKLLLRIKSISSELKRIGYENASQDIDQVVRNHKY